MIKKADIILFISIVLLGIVSSILIFAYSQSGATVKISIAGKTYATYPLSQNKTIELNENSHKNTIAIKDGTVYMQYSDCHNQICVKHAPISKTNEAITCLPNKVMISIEDDKNGGYDAISN